jgi:hypothetical protein
MNWEEVGRHAFANGEHSAPALNADVMAALEGLPVGHPDVMVILGGFSRGWTAANHSQPEPLTA